MIKIGSKLLKKQNISSHIIDSEILLSKTLKRSKLCTPNGVAAISWIKKNGPSINTGPF